MPRWGGGDSEPSVRLLRYHRQLLPVVREYLRGLPPGARVLDPDVERAG